MPLSPKLFSDRLNTCLDDTGAPRAMRERAIVLSKILDIPKQQAWGLLEGHLIPDAETLKRIAEEFEVEIQWLNGDK